MDNLLAAEESTGQATHGILVVNCWKNIPPAQRGTPDTVEFPSNVVERATANNIALLSGRGLLKAVSAKLKGTPSATAFLDRLTVVRGIVPDS